MDVSWQPELLMEFGSLDLTLNPWGSINHNKNWMARALRVLGRAVSSSKNGCLWGVYRRGKSEVGLLRSLPPSILISRGLLGSQELELPSSIVAMLVCSPQVWISSRGSVVILSRGEVWDTLSLVALRWPLPGWGDAEQRAGMCCSTQSSWAWPHIPSRDFPLFMLKSDFTPEIRINPVDRFGGIFW